MAINSIGLFNALRQILGKLSQVQVDVSNALLESCAKHGVTDVHQIAYIFATGCHECNLKPIKEGLASRKGRFYNVPDPITKQIYYGRGCPTQITLKGNYQTFSEILKIDLVNNPDLALNIGYGAEIGVIGMKGGLFTGKSLGNYFTGVTNDPVNSRKIINGLDCAQLIAGYYGHILEGFLFNN